MRQRERVAGRGPLPRLFRLTMEKHEGEKQNMVKIIKLHYLTTETWTLHVLMNENATDEDIVAAAETALSDANFFENATSGEDSDTRFIDFEQVLDTGGENLYNLEEDD